MTFKINRRSFLQAACATLVAPRVSFAQSAIDNIRLVAEPRSFLDRTKIRIRGFNFASPESFPVLRLKQGITAQLHISNTLDFGFTVQFFGVRSLQSTSAVFIPAESSAVLHITPPDCGTFLYRARDSKGFFIPGFCGFVIVEETTQPDVLIGINHAPLAFLPLPRFAMPQENATSILQRSTVVQSLTAESPGHVFRLRFANFSLDRVAAIQIKGAASLAIIAMDGQPCPTFPPFENRLALTPHGRIDALVQQDHRPIEILDEHAPDTPVMLLPALPGKKYIRTSRSRNATLCSLARFL